jgi:hypothetical protein
LIEHHNAVNEYRDQLCVAKCSNSDAGITMMLGARYRLQHFVPLGT